MIKFIKDVINLLQRIVIAILEANLSLFEDLKSFRNKLVFFTCLLVVMIILLDRDYRVMLAALGLFEFFICYYFNNRKIKEPTIVEKITKNLDTCENPYSSYNNDSEQYHD